MTSLRLNRTKRSNRSKVFLVTAFNPTDMDSRGRLERLRRLMLYPTELLTPIFEINRLRWRSATTLLPEQPKLRRPMTMMVFINLRFSEGMALPGLAQFREEEICKSQVGGSTPLDGSTNFDDDLMINLDRRETFKWKVRQRPKFAGSSCPSILRQ
jgi:hypothetical protein